MSKTTNKKRYRVRYDRIVFVGAVLVVLIMILSSCVSSCTKKRKNQKPNDKPGSSAGSNASQDETSESTNTVQPSQAPILKYNTVEMTKEDMHRGNLVLCNQEYPCVYDFAAIDEGTSSEVEMVTIKKILDDKNEEYHHYTASDWEVGMDKEAAYALDAWMEGFYDVTHDPDLRMIRGYRSDSEDLDFRSGRTCTIGIFTDEGSSVYYNGDGYTWFQENAANFGFVLRYPDGKESYFDDSITTRTTGTFRYVGVPVASYMTEHDLCLEEFLTEIKDYSVEDMLEVNAGGKTYGMYYFAGNPNGNTSVSIPTGDAPYVISGNNMDGFVVTIVLSGNGAGTEAPTDATAETETPEAE